MYITLQVHHLVVQYWESPDAFPDLLPAREKLEEDLNSAKYMLPPAGSVYPALGGPGARRVAMTGRLGLRNHLL